jgi:hypothetical protein
MSELYLIAHKVRGKPAFDVAERMACPICHNGAIEYGVCNYTTGTYKAIECHECDGLGYWWIIPTSGHRAYPYASQIIGTGFNEVNISCDLTDTPMPPSLPDHYKVGPAPKVDIISLMKANAPPPAPKVHMPRRL